LALQSRGGDSLTVSGQSCIDNEGKRAIRTARGKWAFGIFTVAVLLATPFGWPVLKLAMNTAGFCFRKFRFVPYGEMVDVVVRDVIDHYSATVYTRQVREIVGENRYRIRWERPMETIPYRNVEEFHRINPDCCKFSVVGKKLAPGIQDTYSGRIWGFIRVRYQVRYRGEDGVDKAVMRELSPAISNCGDLQHGL
jgi:hypothetical protein